MTASASAAHPLLRVGKDEPQRIEVVAAGVDASLVRPLGDSPMLARLAGITGEIPRDRLNELTQAIGPALDPALMLVESARVCGLRLSGGGETRALEVVRLRDGTLGISDFASAESARQRTLWRLKPGRFEAIAGGALSAFSAFEEPTSIEARRIVELDRPYRAGQFTLDAPTIRTRLARSSSAYQATRRDLDDESISARLPRGYDAKGQYGLLVWVDAADAPLHAGVFDDALDRAGLIMVGAARSGNNRPVVDRLQLALDAVETARAHFHVDDERIYASGLSGGGKMATLLWGCFPEVFTGAVPIVGLLSYRAEPAGPGKTYPPEFPRPPAPAMTILRGHRLAPITGDKDFNAMPVRVMSAGMKNDGLTVQVFDDPAMGHEFPPPVLFAKALDWIDQPRRETCEREWAAGATLWREYESQFGANSQPTSPGAREALIKITRDAPWTEQAWQAVDLLRGPS